MAHGAPLSRSATDTGGRGGAGGAHPWVPPCPSSEQPSFPYGSVGPSTCTVVEEVMLERDGKSWARKTCWFSGLTLAAAQGRGLEKVCAAQGEDGPCRGRGGRTAAPPAPPSPSSLAAPLQNPVAPVTGSPHPLCSVALGPWSTPALQSSGADLGS